MDLEVVQFLILRNICNRSDHNFILGYLTNRMLEEHKDSL